MTFLEEIRMAHSQKLLVTRRPARRGHAAPAAARTVAVQTARHTIVLAEAIDRLARAVAALTQHAEMQDRILARVESHLSQEGRWTASALTAVTLASAIVSAPPVQSHRAIKVTRTAPPADAPAIGLLAQLSSDAARMAGQVSDDEASTDAVASTLRVDARFMALRERLPAHEAHCDHSVLSDCLPMLRWLATDGRYARIVTGAATADLLLADYDAAQDARQDAVTVEREQAG